MHEFFANILIIIENEGLIESILGIFLHMGTKMFTYSGSIYFALNAHCPQTLDGTWVCPDPVGVLLMYWYDIPSNP